MAQLASNGEKTRDVVGSSGRIAAKIAPKTTLLPPTAPYSHSIVPGGFEVTS
jgi:hypothetical protein